MRYISYNKIFSTNLIKKRNFFVNLLVISSLILVLIRNIESIRYVNVKTPDGNEYTLDRLTATIKKAK